MEIGTVLQGLAPAQNASSVARVPAPAPAAASTQPTVSPVETEGSAEQLTAERVRPTVDALQAKIDSNRASGVNIRVDETTDRVVTQILNESNETIKQFPPEEALRIFARFRAVTGLLFDLEI